MKIRFIFVLGLLISRWSTLAQSGGSTDPEILFQTGYSRFQSNDYSDAISSLTNSFNFHHFSYTAFYLAMSYARLGDKEASARWSLEALKDSPALPRDFSEAISNNILLLVASQEYKQATSFGTQFALSVRSSTKDVDFQRAEFQRSGPQRVSKQKEEDASLLSQFHISSAQLDQQMQSLALQNAVAASSPFASANSYFSSRLLQSSGPLLPNVPSLGNALTNLGSIGFGVSNAMPTASTNKAPNGFHSH